MLPRALSYRPEMTLARAVYSPTAVRTRCFGLGRKQVGAGVWLAHSNAKTDLAANNCRENIALDGLARISDQRWSALAVGDKKMPSGRIRDAHFFGYNVAFEKT